MFHHLSQLFFVLFSHPCLCFTVICTSQTTGQRLSLCPYIWEMFCCNQCRYRSKIPISESWLAAGHGCSKAQLTRVSFWTDRYPMAQNHGGHAGKAGHHNCFWNRLPCELRVVPNNTEVSWNFSLSFSPISLLLSKTHFSPEFPYWIASCSSVWMAYTDKIILELILHAASQTAAHLFAKHLSNIWHYFFFQKLWCFPVLEFVWPRWDHSPIPAFPTSSCLVGTTSNYFQ